MKLGFGLMRLPLQGKAANSPIDEAKTSALMAQFRAGGGTYFDTAFPYHQEQSEPVCGRLLVARTARDSFTLTSKLPVWKVEETEDMRRIFDEQKQRCQVDYFDYYLLHALDEERYEKMERLGGFDFLQSLKASGEIRHTALSFHDKAAVLERILSRHPEIEYVQLQLNYLDWENPDVEARLCYECARRHGKRLIVMEPLKGGTLAHLPARCQAMLDAVHPGQSPVVWAFRFLAGLEGVEVVLSGMNEAAQVAENLEIFRHLEPLNEAELAAVRAVTVRLSDPRLVPCTACHYCTDGCPMQIAIPEVFQLYNEHQENGEKRAALGTAYQQLLSEHGAAASCVACEQCVKACPQRIPIIDRLRDVAAVFD